MLRRTVLLLLVVLPIIYLCVSGVLADADVATTTERVSVSSAEVEADGGGSGTSISADGRYVAFHSDATNLVAGDTNGWADIFVRDRVTGETERVSISSAEAEGNGPSVRPFISADGRCVFFSSLATNLVAGDTKEGYDGFVRDRVTGETERVSVSSAEVEADGPTISAELSADGRYVAFGSPASNLVAGDTNGSWDAFVRDRVTGETERVSISSAEVEADGESHLPSISADGRYVAFQANATNLVAGDTNAVADVFVRDRVTGETERVSVSSAGAEGNGFSRGASISADGRYVAFRSAATNLVAGDTNGCVDIFVRDRVSGETERVSVSSAEVQANHDSNIPAISADGRYVAFESEATNLVAGDTNGCVDIFVRDRLTGETQRVSVSSATVEADGDSGGHITGRHAISADGRYVAFVSDATNLVAGDTNGAKDVFVRGPLVDYVPRFSDVLSYHWAFDEVEACAAAGIVSGYGDGLYHPEYPVTRDQMAVYISRALAGGDENVPDFSATPTFPDVDDVHWALDYVEYAAAQNVIAGYDDGTYHPDEQVNRAQMAVYVARSICDPTGEHGLAGYIPADPRDFPDVTTDHWAYTHIEYCVENGVVSGYLDGLYHPEAVVTRDQMAVYVARAFGLMT